MAMPKSVMGRAVGLAGLAKDMRAVKRASDDAVRSNARRHLADRMGKLRGLPQKIGQMMSMAADDDRADPFADLTDSAEPLPFDLIRPILEEAWKLPVDTLVSQISERGLAASLGQVHRATLRTGEEVAIKVAYPGIRDAVFADLKMLGWISAPVGDLRRGFDLADYRGEIVRDLNEELDYRTELANQRKFAALRLRSEGLVVPAMFEELSTEHVLVTGWEEGESITEAKSWPAPAREELGRRLLKQFIACVFDHGLIHGDPHAGNYRFRNDPDDGPSVVLYDYGSVVTLSTRDRLLLLRLISDTAAQRGDPMALLVELGFSAELLGPIRRKLPAVCSVLFEPFCKPYKFDLGAWNRAERLDDILGDDRWNFRMAGPAKLILVMRAFRGLLFYLEQLQCSVSWGIAIRRTFTRYQEACSQLELASDGDADGCFESMASHLKIEVRRDGAMKVALTMPACAVDDLDGVIDEDVVKRIRDRGIELAEIVRAVRADGFAPAELFTLEESDGDCGVRVWIE